MSSGSTITNYRKKAGMTSRDLAARIGVTPATMSRYESGTLSVSTEKLEKIADCLCCTVQDLVRDDPEYAYLQEEPDGTLSFRTLEDEILLKGYHGLSPELQDIVRRICRLGL